MQDLASREMLVVFTSHDGQVQRGEITRIGRTSIAFNVYRTDGVLLVSGVLPEVAVFLGDRTVYKGRAVLTSLVNTGLMLACEATLQDVWLEDLFQLDAGFKDWLQNEFKDALGRWETTTQLLPEFKLLTSDMQSALHEVQQWLDQTEFAIDQEGLSEREREARTLSVLGEVEEMVTPSLNELIAKFEQGAADIPATRVAEHRAYCRRILHPHCLCAPIVWRSYRKPLGYAGDYRMIQMIIFDHDLGATMYGKLIHRSIVKQAPGLAYHNRLTYLVAALEEETRRVIGADAKSCRILDLGCGPAIEVERFILGSELADKTEIHLLDFDAETIENAENLLTQAKAAAGRQTRLSFEQGSVLDLIRDRSEADQATPNSSYDLIYCVGLFDYFSGRTCSKLLKAFYSKLAPGGRLITGNFHVSNPIAKLMEYVLDWHLIYRTSDEVRALADLLPADAEIEVLKDSTGVQVYLEVRKPE